MIATLTEREWALLRRVLDAGFEGLEIAKGSAEHAETKRLAAPSDRWPIALVWVLCSEEVVDGWIVRDRLRARLTTQGAALIARQHAADVARASRR